LISCNIICQYNIWKILPSENTIFPYGIDILYGIGTYLLWFILSYTILLHNRVQINFVNTFLIKIYAWSKVP